MLRTGIRLYPKMRHGILGETGHEQVCADLLAWMLEQLF
jgi:alpha-beta hydrolase superfamily lysophospholipase